MLFCGSILLALHACEDDPILEPSPPDDTGGGSYGMLPTLSGPHITRAENPELF